MVFMILNDQGTETEGIKMHLSLQHFCHILLSLTHFKHKENVNMPLRKLSVSTESRQPLENVIISIPYFQSFLGIQSLHTEQTLLCILSFCARARVCVCTYECADTDVHECTCVHNSGSTISKLSALRNNIYAV